MDDSDEDEPLMGRQNLPVARLPEHFDGEPMDGMQYLFIVRCALFAPTEEWLFDTHFHHRRDARKLPNVTRVQNPHELPCPVQRETQENPNVSVRVKLPSEQWRAEFLRRFKNFRKASFLICSFLLQMN